MDFPARGGSGRGVGITVRRWRDERPQEIMGRPGAEGATTVTVSHLPQSGRVIGIMDRDGMHGGRWLDPRGAFRRSIKKPLRLAPEGRKSFGYDLTSLAARA